jgi:hypothetical protein
MNVNLQVEQMNMKRLEVHGEEIVFTESLLCDLESKHLESGNTPS